MLPLPPPKTPPQRQMQNTSVPPYKVLIPTPPRTQHNSTTTTPAPASKRPRKPQSLQHDRYYRTNPLVWFGAIICLIFSLILIFFGIATLIIYLVIKPRNPVFDIPHANLNSIYFDSPEYFNGDLTFLANFSNPNQKIDVTFEHVEIELYFSNRLIGIQARQPFAQRRKQTRLELVHVISSLVYLPSNLAAELQTQVQNNKIIYNVRGSFKVQATIGLIRYSYWLHGRCEIEMTGPPTGVLVARSCKTKR